MPHFQDWVWVAGFNHRSNDQVRTFKHHTCARPSCPRCVYVQWKPWRCTQGQSWTDWRTVETVHREEKEKRLQSSTGWVLSAHAGKGASTFDKKQMQRTRACGRAALNLSKYDDASPWIALNMRRILRIFANSGSVGSILYVRRRFWLLWQVAWKSSTSNCVNN